MLKQLMPMAALCPEPTSCRHPPRSKLMPPPDSAGPTIMLMTEAIAQLMPPSHDPKLPHNQAHQRHMGSSRIRPDRTLMPQTQQSCSMRVRGLEPSPSPLIAQAHNHGS
eukprot:gene18666-25183_t